MDERDDEMADYDFDNDVLEFDPVYYPEPINYLESLWQRQLDHHEMHLIAEVYNWCRNNIQVEEIKLIDLEQRKGVFHGKDTILHYMNPILYYEPILYMQEKWHRHLTEHEIHIVTEIYDWTRTQLEKEEIFAFEWLINKEE